MVYMLIDGLRRNDQNSLWADRPKKPQDSGGPGDISTTTYPRRYRISRWVPLDHMHAPASILFIRFLSVRRFGNPKHSKQL